MYLNTHSYYSLKYGTIAPEALLKQAFQYHITTMALTDINSTSVSLDFVRLAPKYNIKPVLGVDFRNGAQQQFVMIAKNNKALQQLNRYLSEFLHSNKIEIPKRAKFILDTYVIYPYQNTLMDLQENEFMGVKPSDLNQLKFSKWQFNQEKLVVLKTVSFQHKKGFNTHRLLRAIDNNTLLSKLPKSEQGEECDVMISEKALKDIFEEYPQIIENTQRILDNCHISFDFSRNAPKNQKTYSNNEALDFKLLKKLAYDGLNYRYKKLERRVFDRLEKELEMIQQKQFVSYFLINWKILKYARSKRYYYVGRGSGANSLVAYLLRITDVDPIELDLYFERFI
ncbi:MAG: PHP domain-containing protein, partial [Flavobacteriaceae bacterium]|nr:PHP domain-containing protein [Flavobacteriaceae bacterium]